MGPRGLTGIDVAGHDPSLTTRRRLFARGGVDDGRPQETDELVERIFRQALHVGVPSVLREFRLGELAMTGMSDEDADALRKKWTLEAGDIYDDAYIQQFRSENGTKTRRLTLEPAIDPARKIIDLKIVATARR